MEQRRRGLIQVSLFLLALILRLTLFLIASSDEARFIRPDTQTYVRPAINVVNHGAFSASPEEPLEPEFDVTPGFPAFIMAVFALFGRSITSWNPIEPSKPPLNTSKNNSRYNRIDTWTQAVAKSVSIAVGLL